MQRFQLESEFQDKTEVAFWKIMEVGQNRGQSYGKQAFLLRRMIK